MIQIREDVLRVREGASGIDLDLALQSGGLPRLDGGQQVTGQMFNLHFSDLRETKTRIFSWDWR